MDDLGGVKVFHGLEELVHDVAVVEILEYFLADSVVEISLHELEDQVEVLVVVSLDDVVEANHVGVVQLVQIANLSVGPLCIDRVLKSVEDLFQSQGLTSPAVCHLPNVPIGPRTHFLHQRVTCQHVLLHFLAHFLHFANLNIIPFPLVEFQATSPLTESSQTPSTLFMKKLKRPS